MPRAAGCFFATDPTQLRRASREDSAITHFDERCQQACVAFNVGIATAITTTGAPDPHQLWRSVRDEVSHPDLVADLESSREDDPRLLGEDVDMHEHQGFVGVAFRLAFWELLHAPSLEAALIDVVNRGGDADTNGAIVGALLGAVYGEQAIPIRWRDLVLHALEHAAWSALRDTYQEVPMIRDQDLGKLWRGAVLGAGGLVMHAICSTPRAPDLPNQCHEGVMRRPAPSWL